MNFSTDRDLLALEPSLFYDVPIASQLRLQVSDAAVAGTVLTSATADFVAAQVESGSVVLLDNTALEVLTRASATTLTVSRLRNRLGDAAIAPAPGTGLTLVVRTFAPQATLVHDLLLGALQLTDDEPVVSLSAMAHLEALGTLERVYAAAVTFAGDQPGLERKADHYRVRFAQALRRCPVLLDLDGDGVADTRRCLASAELVRV